MATQNEGQRFYQRLNSAYGRVATRSPESIKDLVVELGELIGELAPYAGTQIGLDENDLAQVNEALTSRLKYPLTSTIDLLDTEKLSGVFCQNFRMIANMTLNLFNKTNENGDIILEKITDKLKDILEVLAANGLVKSPV
jgi:hypothetical protein